LLYSSPQRHSLVLGHACGGIMPFNLQLFSQKSLPQ
jgi:hypothetical protein